MSRCQQGLRTANEARWPSSVWRRCFAYLISLDLVSCSWGPIKDVTSLAPGIDASTVGYSDAAAHASDLILVDNILRAKEFAPLNLSQLSSVSGALSATGGLGFTVPFGPGKAAGTVFTTVLGQNMVTPSITLGTSPTFTVNPLNTQAFTGQILQPVFANYVLNLLQRGLPMEIALNLFIKEIDFPANLYMPYRYINDPDNPQYFWGFQRLVSSLINSHIVLKPIDILEPAGPEFTLHAASQNSSNQTVQYLDKHNNPIPYTLPQKTPTPGPPNQLQTEAWGQVTNTTPGPASPPINADQTGFSLITSSNDAQYHVGNSRTNGQAQLYRAYPGQILMCVNASEILGHRVPFVDSKMTSRSEEEMYAMPRIRLAMLINNTIRTDVTPTLEGKFDLAAAPEAPFLSGQGGSSTGTGGGGGASGGSKAGGNANSSSQGGGVTTSLSMTPVLQALRTSAIVREESCRQDQVILEHFTDINFPQRSSHFIHVYWRSTEEIFKYLGAILRLNTRQGRPFPISIAPDPTVVKAEPARERQGFAPAQEGEETGEAPSDMECSPGYLAEACAVLFDVKEGGTGSLSLNYNGRTFAVADIDPQHPRSDYTHSIIDILNALVNYASQSNATQTAAPLRLLPLQ
jgi:hypothetical protein